jgi:hypothetical protein
MWIALALGAVLVVGAVNAADERKKEKEEVANAVDAVDVTAQQLYDAYKANEVSADSRYRGKVLRVSGKVKSIAKDITDEPYLTLEVSGPFDHVRAKFDSERESVLGVLSRGQQVTLRCRGDNIILGSPKLKDCVLD